MYAMVNYNFKKNKVIMHMIIIETNGSYPQLIMEEIKLHSHIRGQKYVLTNDEVLKTKKEKVIACRS